MKKLLAFLLFANITFSAFSQQPLLIQTDARGSHLVHKVAPKEGIYSLGRTYGLAPKDIASFNNIDVNSGLTIGQTILIPLTEVNFSQSKNEGTPVYYIVGEKEGLYRVSMKNNKVLMADLRKWNNLASDAIQTGQKLVIGYLTVGGQAAANTASTQVPVSNPVKTEAPVEKPKTVEATPVVQTDPKPEKKVEPVAPPAAVPAVLRTAVSDGSGGYFKKQFEQQSGRGGKDMTAAAGIFKTASGWQDTKYYALVDGVDPGTIVRVINPANNKAVYAKVLGGMAGIRQNQGFDVRISNAAASVLDVKDTEKFVVKVNY
jgi:LysM repeat protein